MESSQDFVPLLIITADRPAELHDSGANQTIDQVSIALFAGFSGMQLASQFLSESCVAKVITANQGSVFLV